MAAAVSLRLWSRCFSPVFRTFCSKGVIDRGVVLGFYELEDDNEANVDHEKFFTAAAKKFNSRTQGRLKEMIKLSGFKGKLGKSKTFFGIDKDYPCVVIVGAGKKDVHSDTETSEEKETSGNIRQAAAAGAICLRDAGVKTGEIDDFSDPQAAAEGSSLRLFNYDILKSSKKLKVELQLHEHVKDSELRTKQERALLNASRILWKDGLLLGEAQNFARKLMETPSNLMTPSLFADTITKRLSEASNVQVCIRDESWAQENKMGAFLSVGKGSNEPSVFVEVNYFGAEKSDSPPLILIGKGVTFDSGGISIKPSAGMGKMKADMGGAATVCAAFDAIVRTKLPLNVTTLIPLCENMPSGTANKPGDVVTAMNGKTIEIDNTDAEGRLILADALCYASQLNPLAIIDAATLTGAMDIALGQGATGVFTTSPTLWYHLFEAGFDSGERMWRMPLYRHYTKQIESDVADLRNTGKNRSAGACTAAVFLKEFVTAKHWAHLDIAGVMDNSADAVPYLNKGMSGRPTRALVEVARRLTKNKLD